MNNITIIYPDGSAHQVSAIAVQRYRLNGNSFNLLVYADGDSTCITLLAEIGGTLCKVPFHDIDLDNAELLGEILPDRLPNVILSAVLLEQGQDMNEAYEQIQVIANQAEAAGQFFSQPQAVAQQRKYPENHYVDFDGVPHATFEHDLYTTYQYDQNNQGKVGLPQVTYEHLFNIYRLNGSAEFEFKKPLLFREVQDEITRIVNEEQRNSLLEEIPDRTIDMPVTPGTTVADYIKLPDGRVQVALALAIPGIHRYNVTFGKCPDKEVYRDASNPENVHATVLEREFNGAGTDYAFKGGFIGLLPISIGGNIYESAYKITDEKSKKPNRR